jgi:class III poly(R)-hydroxyalkanoic acid synthase PhaE subunit
VAEAWLKLFERFQKELVALAEKGEKIESLERLANFWIELADQVFIEVFRSERYILAQGELLRASMAFRIQQRRIIELGLKSLDLPTRSELDAAHRQSYNQRNALKRLKKEVAELAEARQTIATLQAEVAALGQAVAALQQSGPTSPGRRKRTTGQGKTRPPAPGKEG